MFDSKVFQKISSGAVLKNPEKIKFISDHLKTKKMCNCAVAPIQDGRSKKGSPTCFSPGRSTKLETSPQAFLTFNFNYFATLV